MRPEQRHDIVAQFDKATMKSKRSNVSSQPSSGATSSAELSSTR